MLFSWRMAIAAASIVAKVTRDRLMARLAERHPGYDWEHNAGYGTPAHLAALDAVATGFAFVLYDMLERSGLRAAAVGNLETPLVAAISDPDIDVFVVEASSFRLAHSRYFAPRVGLWLNFAPDHLDVHRSLDDYRLAKARIWADQGPGDVAVVNADDPVVDAAGDDRVAQARDLGVPGPAVVRFGSTSLRVSR